MWIEKKRVTIIVAFHFMKRRLKTVCSEWYDRRDGELDMGFGGLHGRGRRQQDSPIERDLYLTLEEIFHGCIKKMKISRRVCSQFYTTRFTLNKTRTSQVGAISEAQKYSRNNYWKLLEKFFFKKSIWLKKSHNAEKPKKRSFRLIKRFLQT